MQKLKAIAPIVVALTIGGITPVLIGGIFSPAQSKPPATQTQRQQNRQRPTNPLTTRPLTTVTQGKPGTRPVVNWAKPSRSSSPRQTSTEKCRHLAGTARTRCVMDAEFPMRK